MTDAALQWYLPAIVGGVLLGLILFLAAEPAETGRVWRLAGIVVCGLSFSAFAVAFVVPFDDSLVAEGGLWERGSMTRWSDSLLAEWPFATLFAIAAVGGLAASVIALCPSRSTRAWSLLVVAGCNGAILILIDAWTEALILGGMSTACVLLHNRWRKGHVVFSTKPEETQQGSTWGASLLASWGIVAVLLGGIASTFLADPIHDDMQIIGRQASAGSNTESRRSPRQLMADETEGSNAMAFLGVGGVLLVAVAVIQELRKKTTEGTEDPSQGGPTLDGR